MYKKRFFIINILLLILLWSVSLSYAQQCFEQVEPVIALASAACPDLPTNFACYGNPTVDATPAEGVTDLDFDEAGDVAVISDIAGIELSGRIDQGDDWGIAYLNVPAITPQSDTIVDTSIVVFGSVNIQNDSREAIVPGPILKLFPKKETIVRREPSDNAGVLGVLEPYNGIFALVRDHASEWVGFEVDGALGWVSISDLFETDITELPTDLIEVSPMQAFSFSADTGNGCEDISGVLIQTPGSTGGETGRITFRVNDVILQIGSTVFLRSDGNTLWITVLDGFVSVYTPSRRLDMPAGTTVQVPINPVGVPEYIRYEGQDFPILSTLTDVPIAEAYTSPLILDIPFFVHPGENNPVQVPVEYYNADGDAISTIHRTLVSSYSATGARVYNMLLDEVAVDETREVWTQGFVEFSIRCNVDNPGQNGLLNLEISLEDTIGTGINYPWTFACYREQ